MFCHYCGSSLESEEITFEQRLGITADDPEGLLTEEKYVVGSATCDNCGTQTMSVVTDYTNLEEETDHEHQVHRHIRGGEPL